ncbi:hypothetical protein [Arhodomonas sp. SL1]|uniref:hypothetical protein n=1 Tax=Arhodomonas sp. SL1 TaxID=3425691 RepID=UPI003F88097C
MKHFVIASAAAVAILGLGQAQAGPLGGKILAQDFNIGASGAAGVSHFSADAGARPADRVVLGGYVGPQDLRGGRDAEARAVHSAPEVAGDGLIRAFGKRGPVSGRQAG